MYKVYAFSNLNKNYIYVGVTSNIKNRLLRHNKGYEKTTKPYDPFNPFSTSGTITSTIAPLIFLKKR